MLQFRDDKSQGKSKNHADGKQKSRKMSTCEEKSSENFHLGDLGHSLLMSVTHELMQKIGTYELFACNQYFHLWARYYMLSVFALDFKRFLVVILDIQIELAVTSLNNTWNELDLVLPTITLNCSYKSMILV